MKRVRYTNYRPISHAELCAIFGDDPIDAWAAERIQAEPVSVSPPIPVWEIVVMALVCALIGAMLAIGGMF